MALAALRKWSPNFSVWIRAGAVLDLAVQPDDRGLAVGLGGRAERLEHLRGQQRAEVGGGGVDAGGEVLDEALAGPRVLDDGGDDGDAGRGPDLAGRPRSGPLRRW